MSFDNLAKVYYSQKKFTQAKWFILQSNTLSRAKADTSNIISSLLTLSTIKSDIKDYNLALRDLNEALQLSINIHSPKTESQVLKNYAMLYHRLKDFPKEAQVLKKRDSLEERMRKTEEAQLAAQNALQKKKLDSLQSKKKVYSSNIRKLYKNSSGRKIASL
jgi:tetratricopeptide (TPR) repeat protein